MMRIISSSAVGPVRTLLSILSIIILMFTFQNVFAGEKITIAGSSTIKPIVQEAVGKFRQSNPGTNIIIGGGGSSNGVKSAWEGNIDIGMASRSLKAKEKASYPDLKAIPIGKDGVAIIVNKKNPVTDLSKSQIRDIYSGKIKNWSDVGGSKLDISLVGILLHHGTSSVFMKFFGLEAEERGEGAKKQICYWVKGGGKQCGSTAKGVDGNQPACAGVMTNPGAIAFASIGFAGSLAEKGAPVKLIKLDGTTATSANVVSGAYALSRPLLLVTKGETSGVAKKFVDFILSADGQAIVQKNGYIPIK